jgi:hypothetical protein
MPTLMLLMTWQYYSHKDMEVSLSVTEVKIV